MVSTHKMLPNFHDETVDLIDKNTFNLQAKSHDHALNGILCEQSN